MLVNYYEVAPTKIARAGVNFFTYESVDVFQPGDIVTIPLGKKIVHGVVLNKVTAPSFSCKKIGALVEDLATLPVPLLKTAEWMSAYYSAPLANVLQTILPRGLGKNRRKKTQEIQEKQIRKRTNNVLNKSQVRALAAIASHSPATHLLHGITGSGKTQVYIECVKNAIAQNKSSVVLVPEIALTSQIIDEFRTYFGEAIIVSHSLMTESERHKIWQTATHSQKPLVAIGPRSALFLPLKNIGCIVIDECHEPSFKQDQSPKYSALRVASVLGKLHAADVIFGSATPLVSDYHLAKSRGAIIELSELAKKEAVKPMTQIIDMKKRDNFRAHRFLSNPLVEAIEQTIGQGKQTLIFHNRRGSASVTLCENCGWQSLCLHCFVPMVLHMNTHNLRCHICDTTEKIPKSCPECNNAAIIHKGIGTKMIETELQKIFPKAKIARFDGDTEKSESLEKVYKQLYDGDIDIIIGTQIVAKGLDLPNLRTVGVVQADAGLALPDFNASERTFQLLSQAVGRVGRSHHATNVIVQTYQPEHSSIQSGVSQNYHEFYKKTIEERSRASFPPFVYLLKLTCSYKTEASSIKNARALAKKLLAIAPKSTTILGPTPSFYERVGDSYRWQIIIKSPKRAELLDLTAEVPPAHWMVDIDPATLL